MRKIYCKDLKRIILFNQCYHTKNENCNSCTYNIKTNFAKLKSNSPKSKLPQIPFRNDELIIKIKRDISLFKNLHPSFWKQGSFVYWQLLRLNNKYQKDIQIFWNAIRECQKYLSHKFVDQQEKFEIVLDIHLFSTDFSPRINDTYDIWVDSLFWGKKGKDFFNRYPFLSPLKDPTDFWRKYGEPIFWSGRILNAKFQRHKMVDIEVEFGSTDKSEKVKIDRLGNIFPPPIPSHIRFPFLYEKRFESFMLPFFDREMNLRQDRPRIPFLDNLLSLQSKLHCKQGRPRKEDWPTNLLVYELSLAGMRNMEIARLLFGVEKSTEVRPDQIKHPILVKIDKIKKRIECYVSEIYP